MFNLTTTNEMTMSSLEIAELTDKQHKHVLYDIRKMLTEIGSAEKTADYKDAGGRTYPMLLLNRAEVDCLITGYSAKLRMTVIKRWHELEAKPSFQLPDFTNPIESARAWADQFEEKQIAYQKLEEQSQKIDSLENLFTEGMTIAAFCKQLNGVNTQAVSRFLVTKNWLYSDKKGWRVGSYARDKYLTEKAAHKYLNSKDEEVVTYKQELLKRGASRLHDMYMKGELPMKKDWDGSYDHSKFLFSREVA